VIFTTRGSVESTRGSIQSTRGSIESTRGNIFTTRGFIQSTRGFIESTSGNIFTTRGFAESTRGNIFTTRGFIQSTRGSVESTRGKNCNTHRWDVFCAGMQSRARVVTRAPWWPTGRRDVPILQQPDKEVIKDRAPRGGYRSIRRDKSLHEARPSLDCATRARERKRYLLTEGKVVSIVRRSIPVAEREKRSDEALSTHDLRRALRVSQHATSTAASARGLGRTA